MPGITSPSHCWTHLLMEGVVSTHIYLSQSHPVFKILAPHFLYLIAINTRALGFLVSEGGWIDNTMTYGVKGLFELVRQAFNTWRMDRDGLLPEDLKARGLDELKVLPCYHFCNDAMLLYEAIETYVTAYVHRYYTSKDLLLGDEEIQNWVQEMAKERNNAEGGLGIIGLPGGGKLTCNHQLIKILISTIYTCSVSQAASNFPHYEEYGFPPNYPGMLRGKPPSNKTRVTKERDFIDSIPDRATTVDTTLDIMIITKILGTRGTNKHGNLIRQPET